jgi:hypothetical protein
MGCGLPLNEKKIDPPLAGAFGVGYVRVCLFSVPAPPRYASVSAGFFHAPG